MTVVPSKEGLLLELVDREQLMAHVRAIAQWRRDAGTVEEAKAMRYIADQLKAYGFSVEQHMSQALISFPLAASLAIDGRQVEPGTCITHAFGASTGPPLIAEAVVAAADGLKGMDQADVRGKIVVLDGIALPHTCREAEQMGAVGLIFSSYAERVYQMAITSNWGTPSLDGLALQPGIPIISVPASVGRSVKEAVDARRRLTVATEVSTEWRAIPTVVGHLAGGVEDQDYVLLSNHVDSWFYGAMDNAAANATALEVARILSQHRQSWLFRGLRLAFWSGHSQGRYAGSAWYADQHWFDLHDHCVAHINVDSTGARGATLYTDVVAMEEAAPLVRQAVRQVVGGETNVRRMGRAGDQSFWGIGVSSMLMSLSRVPEDSPHAMAGEGLAELTGRRSGRQPWWWHTEDDTIDKIDPDVLDTDTRIYLAVTARLCGDPLVPLDFRTTATAWREQLEAVRSSLGDRADLDQPLLALSKLKARIDTVYQLRDQFLGRAVPDGFRVGFNDLVRSLGRALIPPNYTAGSSFEHDAAVPTGPFPGLRASQEFLRLAPDASSAKVIEAAVKRECNRITYGIRSAIRAVEAFMARHTDMTHQLEEDV